MSGEFGPFDGMWQRNNVFEALGVGGLNTSTTALYVQILDNTTATYWYPYVAVNDNGTSDPTFFTHGRLGRGRPSSTSEPPRRRGGRTNGADRTGIGGVGCTGRP